MNINQIQQFINAPEKLNRETLPILKELTEQYPAFETGWILYLKNLKNLNDSLFEQELLNGAIRIHDRRKLYLFLNEKSRTEETDKLKSIELEDHEDSELFELIYPSDYRLDDQETEEGEEEEETMGEIARSLKKKTEKKDSLIEKFLEIQPKMSPVKEEEYSPANEVGKKKADDDDDFVTETLALIYAKQGYNKKAIHIFEKLSLKYPEKSTYFAGQIEKIKNLMNN